MGKDIGALPKECPYVAHCFSSRLPAQAEKIRTHFVTNIFTTWDLPFTVI